MIIALHVLVYTTTVHELGGIYKQAYIVSIEIRK